MLVVSKNLAGGMPSDAEEEEEVDAKKVLLENCALPAASFVLGGLGSLFWKATDPASNSMMSNRPKIV
jgi:hypothetical protein